jgi:hypothetical protein
VTSPKPLPAPAATAVWSGVAFLVAVSTVQRALVSGADLEARRNQLADEQGEQVRQERRLFWRTVAISALVAALITARLVAG